MEAADAEARKESPRVTIMLDREMFTDHFRMCWLADPDFRMQVRSKFPVFRWVKSDDTKGALDRIGSAAKRYGVEYFMDEVTEMIKKSVGRMRWD